MVYINKISTNDQIYIFEGLKTLVDFAKVIRERQLLDIVTVDGMHYGVCAAPNSQSIPGCTVIHAGQIPQYLQLFLRAGYSERYRMPYARLVGLRSWILLRYSLAELPALHKQTLSHALSGVQGRPGALARWGGEKVGRTACLVPLESEADATAFFAARSVPYTTEVVLRGE